MEGTVAKKTDESAPTKKTPAKKPPAKKRGTATKKAPAKKKAATKKAPAKKKAATKKAPAKKKTPAAEQKAVAKKVAGALSPPDGVRTLEWVFAYEIIRPMMRAIDTSLVCLTAGNVGWRAHAGRAIALNMAHEWLPPAVRSVLALLEAKHGDLTAALRLHDLLARQAQDVAATNFNRLVADTDFQELTKGASGHVPDSVHRCAEYVLNRRGALPADDPLAIFWAGNASALAGFTVHPLDAARTSLVAQQRQVLLVLRRLEKVYVAKA
jgi:hypothetical protein